MEKSTERNKRSRQNASAGEEKNGATSFYDGELHFSDKFAARLMQLRTEKGVSARDMSLSLGQNPAYINNIESGKALPSMTAFFYICDFLDITPRDFFDVGNSAPQKAECLSEKIKQLSAVQLDLLSALTDELLK